MVWRHSHQPCLDQRLSDFRLSRRYATSLSFLQNPPLHIWPHPIHHPLAIDFNRLHHPPTPVHQRLLPLCDLKHGSVGCLCRIVLANKCLSKLCVHTKQEKERKARERVLSLMLSCGQYLLECKFLGLWVENPFRRVSKHLIFR